MDAGRINELRRQAKRHIAAATTITMFPQELLALIELVDAQNNAAPPPAREPQPKPAVLPPPVDRTARTLADGSPVTEDHRELKPNGQQKDYVVLSAEERARGFVRPVRRTYVHEKCGVATTMSHAIAETYARDPYFHSGTFCCGCGKHFPVGDDGEFVWGDGSKVGT
jgi:hypothetical protein